MFSKAAKQILTPQVSPMALADTSRSAAANIPDSADTQAKGM